MAGDRVEKVQKADKILVEEAPVLPLCYARIRTLVKPWVRKHPTSLLKWWY